MPSKLPIIKANTTNENIVKKKTFAKYIIRILANELEFIIEILIDEFVLEHGEIEIYQMSANEIVEDIKDRIVGNPPY